MSSCANIVNRLQSDVCLLKENWNSIDMIVDILQINQEIFLESPFLVYLIPTNPNGIGIPVTIESENASSLTTTTYSGLIVLDPTGSQNCVVFTTETLLSFGRRTSGGFFEMLNTLPIVVVNANPSILPNLTYSEVIAALDSCSGSNDNHTVNCVAYNALLVFLKKNFGVRNLTPSVAACFYDYFNENRNINARTIVEPIVEKEEPVVYLPVDEKSKTEVRQQVVLPPIDDLSKTVASVVLQQADEKSKTVGSVVLQQVDEKSKTVGSVVLHPVDDLSNTVSSVVLKPSINTSRPSANIVLKPVINTSRPVANAVLPPVINTSKQVATVISLPVNDLYETCVERAYPFEPFEPFDPLGRTLNLEKDIKVEKVEKVEKIEKVKKVQEVKPVVRHIEDSGTNTYSTTESSSNDAIEAKLRALLEATETSEVSRTE